MRTIAPLDEGPFSYARMGYANPDAVTQIANGVSTSTFTYDNNGNLAQKTTDGVTTTYLYDYANRLTALGSQGATTTYSYDDLGNNCALTTNQSHTVVNWPFLSLRHDPVGGFWFFGWVHRRLLTTREAQLAPVRRRRG